MARYRIGNDMTVVWSIYDHTGAAYYLKGKEVRLYYTCERGRFEADFEIQGTNKVVWSFWGREQKVIGDYTLSLEIIESAGKRRIFKDYCNAFTLVGKSCEEAALGNPNISEDGNIVLSSKLDVYKIQPIIPTVGSNSNWFVDDTDTGKPSTGKSAYEYAKEKGYEGTESEYAESLKLAPENAEKLAELSTEIDGIEEVLLSIERGQYYKDDGTSVKYAKSKITELLLLPQADIIIYNAWQDLNLNTSAIIYVDDSMNIVGSYAPSDASEFTFNGSYAPSSAQYFIVQFQRDTFKINGRFEKSGLLYSSELAKNRISQDVSQSVKKDELKEDGVYSATEWTKSVAEYINAEGTIYQNKLYSFTTNQELDGNGWLYSDIIVKEGEIYKVKSYAGQNARRWGLYNGSTLKLVSSADKAAFGETEETIVIPSGITMMRVNAYTRYPYYIKRLENKVDADKVYYKGINIIDYIASSDQSNPLSGKTLVCVGDSITYGDELTDNEMAEKPIVPFYQWRSGSWQLQEGKVRKTYGYNIALRNKMVFYNGGINGSTMQGLTEKNGFSLENGRYTQLPEHIDYLTIWFGWNDNTYGTLGTISDTSNESYYGGYNVVLPYLIDKYPYAKIILIVPFGTTEGHRNAIRQLANKWGLACFDMYQGGTPLYFGKEDSVGVEPSIVTANRTKFQAKPYSAHPNAHGHKQLADMLEAFLKGV